MPIDDRLASERTPTQGHSPEDPPRISESEYEFLKKISEQSAAPPPVTAPTPAPTPEPMYERPVASAEPRKLLSALPLVLLAIVAAFFLFRSLSLESKNRSLSSSVKDLESAVKSFEDQNKTLTEKLAQAEMSKNQLEEKINSSKNSSEATQADMQKYENDLRNLQEEKTYLEEMLINKTKEIERLKAAPSAAAPVLAGVAPNAAAEIARLTEQNRMLSAKLDRYYKTVNDKITEINVAKITLEETVSKARKSLDEEWSAVDLGSITMEKNGTPSAPVAKAKTAEAKKAPRKEGRILAVNDDHGFVVVDLGRGDLLNTETELTVKKDGQKIATLSVLEVRDAMAACNIKNLESGKTLAVNDQVYLEK